MLQKYEVMNLQRSAVLLFLVSDIGTSVLVSNRLFAGLKCLLIKVCEK